MDEYDGKFVGIDLHRQRSVIVRQSESGEQLSAVRIINDPVALGLEIERAGPNPEVVLEATYGWYWAVDTLQAQGAQVHLAHPLGVKGFRYRRVKNDVRAAADLADLLRMNRLPEAWIAPPATRELRELVRYRAKIVALRSGLKAQVHAVLAKAGVVIPVSDLFGVGGRQRLAKVPLAAAYVQRVISLLRWTNIWFPVKRGSLQGDWFGGPLQGLFDPGIRDIPVQGNIPGRLARWGRTHSRYFSYPPRSARTMSPTTSAKP